MPNEEKGEYEMVPIDQSQRHREILRKVLLDLDLLHHVPGYPGFEDSSILQHLLDKIDSSTWKLILKTN